MHYGKERGVTARLLVIRPFSSMAECLFGKEATQDRNLHRAPCSSSPIGRDDCLRNNALRVRVLPGAPIARLAKR